MRLLKELTEANGVSGHEQEVRNIMIQEMKEFDLKIHTDGLGSVFFEKKGDHDSPRVLVAGHLDEVGFMVTEITKEGYLRFAPIGGWWDQVLLSQRVSVVTPQRVYTGVIGSKPPHLLSAEERKKVYTIKEMFIDVGAHSREQVKKWGISPGAPVVPICPFEILPDGDTILAKALDNRMGCYVALEVLKQLMYSHHPNTVIAGATAQEEVGLRGAATAPHQVKPDIALVVDVGIAEDAPGESDSTKPKLRKGPVITFYDAYMIPNVALREQVIAIAEREGIPYQVEILSRGGTDAGNIHLYQQGIPAISLGVAARYIHSHVSMVSKTDIENLIRLLVNLIKQMDQEQVRKFTQYVFG